MLTKLVVQWNDYCTTANLVEPDAADYGLEKKLNLCRLIKLIRVLKDEHMLRQIVLLRYDRYCLAIL